MENHKESPSQTAGPYVHIGCTPNTTGITNIYPRDLGANMKDGRIAGEQIKIRGTVYDGSGAALTDALVEIWQADASGAYNANPDFTGWGRSSGNMETGEFTFETIKPGPVPNPDGPDHAPHITIWIVARGINVGLHTRLYFEDEEVANSTDPVLSLIEDTSRIQTLMARKQSDGTYLFNIVLQGENETIFFDA